MGTLRTLISRAVAPYRATLGEDADSIALTHLYEHVFSKTPRTKQKTIFLHARRAARKAHRRAQLYNQIHQPLTHDEVESNETLIDFSLWLQSKDPLCRQCFLEFLQGFTLDEIAQKHSISRNKAWRLITQIKAYDPY